MKVYTYVNASSCDVKYPCSVKNGEVEFATAAPGEEFKSLTFYNNLEMQFIKVEDVKEEPAVPEFEKAIPKASSTKKKSKQTDEDASEEKKDETKEDK